MKRKATPPSSGFNNVTSSSSSSSSSNSTSNVGAANKKPRITPKLPDGTPWMAPYFSSIESGKDIEGKIQRHVLLSMEIRTALKLYIEKKDKLLVKIKEEIGKNQRYHSQYNGLQVNGCGWAAMANIEGGGNAGRHYVDNVGQLGEKKLAVLWDQKMVQLNGMSCVWKLNFPKDTETLRMIEATKTKNIGQILTWGGKFIQGQYKCTEYYGTFQVLSQAECVAPMSKKEAFANQSKQSTVAVLANVATSTSSSSSSSSKGTSSSSSSSSAIKKVKKKQKPLPAANATWVPGNAAPFVAMAKIGGKAIIIGKYSSAIEAAICYDEFADVVSLPMNNIKYDALRKSREIQREASCKELTNKIDERGWKLTNRGRKSTKNETTNNKKDMKMYNIKEFNDLKETEKLYKKLLKEQDKLVRKSNKYENQIKKIKDKDTERKNKLQQKKVKTTTGGAQQNKVMHSSIPKTNFGKKKKVNKKNKNKPGINL